MLHNLPSRMNDILNHGAKPLALFRPFGRCLSLTDCLLPKNAQNVVGNHCQFQHQLVGFKLARGHTLYP